MSVGAEAPTLQTNRPRLELCDLQTNRSVAGAGDGSKADAACRVGSAWDNDGVAQVGVRAPEVSLTVVVDRHLMDQCTECWLTRPGRVHHTGERNGGRRARHVG